MKNIPIKQTPDRSTVGVNKEEIIFLKDCCTTIYEKSGELLGWSEFGKFVMMKYAEEAVQDIIFELKKEQKK